MAQREKKDLLISRFRDVIQRNLSEINFELRKIGVTKYVAVFEWKMVQKIPNVLNCC